MKAAPARAGGDSSAIIAIKLRIAGNAAACEAAIAFILNGGLEEGAFPPYVASIEVSAERLGPVWRAHATADDLLPNIDGTGVA
jgi:hypothetical protein